MWSRYIFENTISGKTPTRRVLKAQELKMKKIRGRPVYFVDYYMQKQLNKKIIVPPFEI